MDEHKTDINTDFDAELASYLSSCEGAGSYRVLEMLKSSDFEVTEKVVVLVYCGVKMKVSTKNMLITAISAATRISQQLRRRKRRMQNRS